MNPIVVAIDEAQRFKRDNEDPLAKLFQDIHDGCNLPLTLVLAGLSDTADRMAAMGLARGLTIHPIGALPASDAISLMHGFCVHFGMDRGSHDASLAHLAEPCEGWPRHLHFALRALGRAVLATEGDLACVDWEQIEAEAAESRIHYYQGQQSPAMQTSLSLVAAVMRDLMPGQRRFDIINSIMAYEEACPGRQWCLPKGMDADLMADHLIHQGALQTMPDGTITAPIPSFRTHLVAAGRLETASRPAGR